MARTEQSRRALILAGVLAVAVLVVLDLLRPDSLLRGWWGGVGGTPQTPLERTLDRILP